MFNYSLGYLFVLQVYTIMRVVLFMVPMVIFIACETAIERYDNQTGQTAVVTNDQIDSVLATLDQVPYKELSEAYKKETGIEGKFRKMVRKGTFYKVGSDDIYKFVVGNIRIMDFIAHDDYYKKNISSADKSYEQIWLIDKKILYKVLELKKQLIHSGLDPNGFRVRCGHRHPVINEEVGGASRSQHIAGKAVDIVVEDINMDGKANQIDKELLLDILNDEVIGNQGGIGRYPGTMSVHFDVRGNKARWDSY